jgi:hypothetical protein
MGKLEDCGMRTKLLIVLCGVVVIGIASLLRGQGGIGQGNPCAFDCYEIRWMGGVQFGQPYCYKFEVLTGRLVWSPGVPVGGTPVESQQCSSQTVVKYTNCPMLCNSNELPQEVNQGTQTDGTIGFGCWDCSG